MRVIGHLLRLLHRDERGAVLIFVVGFLPIAIGMAAFVIDIANGFEHRRHLQLQSDAGALAAAHEFRNCFLDEAAANAAIEAQALSYSGADYNTQIGSAEAQDRIESRINASSWSADSYTDGDPCDTGFVDLKLTEKDSPAFFPFVGDHDYRGHTRIQVFRLQSSSRLLPIAVPDPTPQVGRVYFINEATGATLAEAPLTPNGQDGDLAVWDNATAAADVPFTVENVGVRVALSGGSSAACTSPLVNCYDSLTPPGHGIVHIRGWTADGQAGAKTPIARRTELIQGTGGCPDPYFMHITAPCLLGLDAVVDFGSSPVTLGATVAATVGGNSYPLTFNAGTGHWTTGPVIPVLPGAGPVEVGLHWTIDRTPDGQRCNGNTCRGDIASVQRTFSATPSRSGQIEKATVTEGTSAVTTFERCGTTLTSCTHSLVVKVGLRGALGLSDVDDPPVRLRVIDGSQNQSLDCDPDVAKLKDELANGCRPAYTKNPGDEPCPDSPAELWADPNPPAIWDCVATQTGNATNQIAEGLNVRILGEPKPTTCPDDRRNHWPDYPDGDRRVVLVIVTPFGSFNGSGNTTVPVLRFAAFYVTGWTGQGSGFDNPCLALPPDQNPDEAPTDEAEIVGRFITYVETPNEGGESEDPCDFSALDPCIAVMVE
jgi:Putative Flp pilus-assembly TadE/G-like